MNTTVKSILIAIIGIGLITLIVLLVNRGDNNTETESAPSSQQQTQNENNSENSQAGDTSTPNESDSDVAATVRYQNGQFSPQTVTIETGDTVKFVNQGDGDMWVGSDQHPTHTEYDGTSLSEHCQDGDATSRVFDQCSSGDTYTFTFEKNGEWDYHNHVNASAGGTVVVE